jgi:hypothetical protein
MVKTRWLPSLWLCVLLCAFLLSCLAKTGHISWQASDEVEDDLAKGHLPPGLTFYYSGPEAIPHTIIGIASDQPFQQNFWQPVAFGGQQVKEWLADIDNRHRSVRDMYFGGRLVDRQGNFLGIWYSKYRFFSGYFDSDSRLVILRPLRPGRGPAFELKGK